MGGFANLKKDFEQLLVVLRPDGYAPDAERDHLQDTIVARYLELRCLFEIAGNLDTIAVEMRAQTKELAGIREEISGK